MTPEERRIEQIDALTISDGPIGWNAEEYLDSLLAYFSRTEFALAEAIRYGLVEITDAGWIPDKYTTDGAIVRSNHRDVKPKGVSPLFRVNCPDGHP